MFAEHSLQSQLIKEDLQRLRKRYNKPVKSEQSFLKTTIQKAKKYLILFLETSSIHGLNHLVVVRRHSFEM